MIKTKFDAIIVVEGKSDVDFIGSFIDADLVISNGSAISRETIDYLKKASEKRTIVVMTDPDSPGKRIRDAIAAEVPSVLHAFIPKEKAIKRHKVGVAESDKETVLEALKHLIPEKSPAKPALTMADLAELGLIGQADSSAKREQISHRLSLGHANGKTLLKRLNALGMTKEDLIDGRE